MDRTSISSTGAPAVYVDKLIKGAPAPSLPVEPPVNFYLAINVKTAKALGLKI